MKLFSDLTSGAHFSDDRKYRYLLWRQWDASKPYVMFIGLNPSTANEETDDPTIRRVKQFAKDWGYGGVYMTNLFAICSRHPKILKTCDDPIGDNDEWLTSTAARSQGICFAWGNFKEATERAKVVAAMFPDGYCLELNKNGTPKHPLYVKSDVKRILYHSKQYLITV